MNYFLILFIMLASTLANAEETLPSSCKTMALSGESVTLSAKKPMLAMIHNISSDDLWITHPVSDPGASAGWSSRLQAGNWSALAVDKESFELSCIESKPGHEQQVSCSAVITLCNWSAIKMPEQNSGTFWAGENMSLPSLVSHLSGRGFELPALSQ